MKTSPSTISPGVRVNNLPILPATTNAGVARGEAPAGSPQAPTGYLEASLRCLYSTQRNLNVDIPYRLVGFKKLRNLLQPKHAYFKGSEGYLRDFSYHDDADGKHFCYPRVKMPFASGRNPYRKAQLRSKHTARTIKKLLALRESAKMDDFKVTALVLTFPKGLSEWLSKQRGDGVMAWRLLNRFWAEDYATLDDDSDGQAAYVNLHKWKTEEPIKAHYHFHCIVPNYRLTGAFAEDELWDSDSSPGIFEKKAWHRQRGGRIVPFSDGVLVNLKQKWHSRLVKFATRHGIRELVPADWQEIDVYVDYVAWDSDIGKAKLMNKLNYQSRHWLEDYATYSNKYPECVVPPAWLESYINATRVFGWWKQLKSLTPGVELNKKEVLSPLDGKPMEYQAILSLDGLLDRSDGDVATLEFCKGMEVWGRLSDGDIAWLRSVKWFEPGDRLLVEDDS